ncbi:MAG: globin [Cyclobacteriaceae bacterium]|jgi:hemoglobin|nr:globin [Flammeovirgaceae bacterium]MCZ8020617.1 globin [Cytophagales bacterium]MCZ8326924.1 globin [Cyclobacteriaceae bacterium]
MEETLYEQFGEENLRKLVQHFYDLVFEHPHLSPLFKTDKELIKEKQFLFLTQFFGGSDVYSQRYGHPRLKARHLPHPIGKAEVEAWLQCMALAFSKIDADEKLKDLMFQKLVPPAFFMANKE